MNTFKKILFATDFSNTSKAARQTALELQSRLGAQLEMIHVFDPNYNQPSAAYFLMPDVDTWLPEHCSLLREQAEKLLGEWQSQMGECASHLVEGSPGKTLIEYASNHGFDLIVLGTHGFTGWNRMMLGSIAEYVVRHACVPVLTIKAEGQ